MSSSECLASRPRRPWARHGWPPSSRPWRVARHSPAHTRVMRECGGGCCLLNQSFSRVGLRAECIGRSRRSTYRAASWGGTCLGALDLTLPSAPKPHKSLTLTCLGALGRSMNLLLESTPRRVHLVRVRVGVGVRVRVGVGVGVRVRGGIATAGRQVLGRLPLPLPLLPLAQLALALRLHTGQG